MEKWKALNYVMGKLGALDGTMTNLGPLGLDALGNLGILDDVMGKLGPIDNLIWKLGILDHAILQNGWIRLQSTLSNYSGPKIKGYDKFSLRLIGSAMFNATFNLVTRVGLPLCLEHW